MDYGWIAIGLNDMAWVPLAFVLGLLARSIGLPPLVGFLATGFLVADQAPANRELLEKVSDLGITLLLFTVGGGIAGAAGVLFANGVGRVTPDVFNLASICSGESPSPF